MMRMRMRSVLTDPGVHKRHSDALRVTLLLPFKDATGDHLQLQLTENKVVSMSVTQNTHLMMSPGGVFDHDRGREGRVVTPPKLHLSCDPCSE